MPALTRDERAALRPEDFAFPEKRMVPIHDADHVKMAWAAVGMVKASEEERLSARHIVTARAAEFGLEPHWKFPLKLSLTLSAMALNISNSDHPNKMPFSGVLTRIGESSDEPPGGSGGRHIIISREAAEKNLGSLLGMAVDYTPGLDGHDPQAKIGVITAATIEGSEIHVEGFIYAADFPDIAEEIKAKKDVLGMSYECRNLYTDNPDSNPVNIIDCVFTGAAILLKSKAAYHSTSISAQKDNEMSPEEKAQLDALTASIAALTENLTKIAASVDEVKTKAAEKVDANASTMALVEPHACACEACANGMEAAGIGNDPGGGHAMRLRKMAGSMRAEAAMGKVPHIYRDHDYGYSANAEPNKEEDTDVKPEELKAALEAATKPLLDQIAAMGTQVADLKAAAVRTAEAPARKTLGNTALNAEAVTKAKDFAGTLMAKHGLSAPADGEKLSVTAIDEALSKANLPTSKRLEVKSALRQGGYLD